MRKFLILLFACMLLSATALADELFPTWKVNDSSNIKADVLTDGSDETKHSVPSAKSSNFACTLGEGESVRAAYVRMNSIPAQVELQYLNKNRKWETVATAVNPGTECLLVSDFDLTGRLRVLVTFASNRPTHLTELRVFTDAASVPADLHVWQSASLADVLVTVDSLAALDLNALTGWVNQGRSVVVASLTTPGEPLAATDALWEAGLRVTPIFGSYAETTRTAKNALQNWGEKKVAALVSSWLRGVKPMLLVNGGEVVSLVMDAAAKNAMNPDYELEDAAANGLWVVPESITMQDAVADAIAALPERDDSLLRDVCATPFKDAVSSDVSLIPYPDNRDAEGYLLEGEFVFEDAEKGLWAYLSPTLQVEIIQYDMTNPSQRYFVADLKFKPEHEMFKQHIWLNASFKGQQIYPQTLAQSSKLVLAVNGDYYPYRIENKTTVGNILRDYKVLYNMDMKKNPGFPPLDTLALHDDGSISVYGAKEITADELAARGDVHDALSFGPYMARDGILRVYNGKNASLQEPRCAIGMVEPGHYVIVDCEGRIPNGPKGMSINQIGMLLYAEGCNESFLLDGGSTSVLIFMGEKLNRTGKDTFVGSPRNQHELFGIGFSELVHTDWFNGKPKN